MTTRVLGYKICSLIPLISIIFILINPVHAIPFTELEMDGIASNSLSNAGRITVVPASLDIFVLSEGDQINQQRTTFSGVLTINDEKFNVEGTIYTHDFQMTSMTEVSSRHIFYKLKFANSGYLIGLYKESVISCHGRFQEYIISFEGTIDKYPSAQLAPFWG